MKQITTANLQLIYVSDIEKSTRFYQSLFNTKPVFLSPRYVAFSASASGDALFALWSGGDKPAPKTPRYQEIGIMLPTDNDVEKIYSAWKERSDINFVSKIATEVFGQTFLINDPDGHVIRICSAD